MVLTCIGNVRNRTTATDQIEGEEATTNPYGTHVYKGAAGFRQTPRSRQDKLCKCLGPTSARHTRRRRLLQCLLLPCPLLYCHRCLHSALHHRRESSISASQTFVRASWKEPRVQPRQALTGVAASGNGTTWDVDATPVGWTRALRRLRHRSCGHPDPEDCTRAVGTPSVRQSLALAKGHMLALFLSDTQPTVCDVCNTVSSISFFCSLSLQVPGNKTHALDDA